MPDRRRQRHQRTQQNAGVRDDPVGASNRNEVWPKPAPAEAAPPERRPERQGGGGVSYADTREYERVTIMPDKEAPTEPQKYRRREVISNWSRYEDLPPEEPEEGEDYMIGEDFSQILEQQASGSGGFLKLKGEKMWDDAETGILTSHGLGALNVADLVAAFDTIPLYEQLNMPEESLPKSVAKYYKTLATDNRKLYMPIGGYKNCLDVNEKILQSLKISEDEPLKLTSDEQQNSTYSSKNAVDVALTLGSDFAPEPEDVDLDTLIREPSPEKRPTPVRDLPRSAKGPTPVKEVSPPKEYSPMRDFAPVKEPSPMKGISPVKEISPVKNISPVKEFSPVKEPNPTQEVSFVNEMSRMKEISPAKEIPNVACEALPVPKELDVNVETKSETETVVSSKEQRKGRREGKKQKEKVKEKSPQEQVKEKSPMEKVKEKSPMEKVKEKSPMEKVKEKSPIEKVKEKSPVEKMKEKSPVEKMKEKSPPKLDFNVPKLEMGNTPMEFNFGLPKANIAMSSESKKKTKDDKKELDLPTPLKLEEKEEAEVPAGPVIDLDAPVKAEKPVLLLSKTEADDLEDWLDSVLDD